MDELCRNLRRLNRIFREKQKSLEHGSLSDSESRFTIRSLSQQPKLQAGADNSGAQA